MIKIWFLLLNEIFHSFRFHINSIEYVSPRLNYSFVSQILAVKKIVLITSKNLDQHSVEGFISSIFLDDLNNKKKWKINYKENFSKKLFNLTMSIFNYGKTACISLSSFSLASRKTVIHVLLLFTITE